MRPITKTVDAWFAQPFRDYEEDEITEATEEKAVRRVRTPEGAELYDQAIGSIIRPDLPGGDREPGAVQRGMGPGDPTDPTRSAADRGRATRRGVDSITARAGEKPGLVEVPVFDPQTRQLTGYRDVRYSVDVSGLPPERRPAAEAFIRDVLDTQSPEHRVPNVVVQPLEDNALGGAFMDYDQTGSAIGADTVNIHPAAFRELGVLALGPGIEDDPHGVEKSLRHELAHRSDRIRGMTDPGWPERRDRVLDQWYARHLTEFGDYGERLEQEREGEGRYQYSYAVLAKQHWGAPRARSELWAETASYTQVGRDWVGSDELWDAWLTDLPAPPEESAPVPDIAGPVRLGVPKRQANAWAALDPDVAEILGLGEVRTEQDRLRLLRSADRNGVGAGWGDKPALRQAISDEARRLQQLGAIPAFTDADTPSASTRFSGDASKVVTHQSDPNRHETLLQLYAEALDKKGRREDWLFDEENRQAAKRGVADRLFARLAPDVKEQLAGQAAATEYSTLTRMADSLLSPEDRARVSDDPLSPEVLWNLYDYDGGRWTIDPGENFARWFPDSPYPHRDATFAEENRAIGRPQNPEPGETYPSPGGYNVRYARGDDPELRDALAKEGLSQFIANWADTSNDNNPRSLAIQEAIREEFGLDDAMDWDVQLPAAAPLDPRDFFTRDAYEHAKEIAARDLADWNGWMEKERTNIPLYRKLVRAQYDETQAWLADHGITEMLVYRGMKWGTKDTPPDWFANTLDRPNETVDFTYEYDGETHTETTTVPPTIATPQLRPASSWAWSSVTARNFAGRMSAKDEAIMASLGQTPKPSTESSAVLSTVVPASAILGTPRTGFGALPEQEVVILAFAGTVQVDARGPLPQETT